MDPGKVIPIQDSNGPPDKLKKQLQIISIIAIIGLILSASALTIALLNMNDNSDDDSDDDQGTNQVADMDKDGVPDAQDIYNLGNGKLKVSIELFKPEYTDPANGVAIYPDPYFNITVDFNGDGIFDDQSISHTFSQSSFQMNSPFFAVFDIPDNATSVTIYISAFDDNFEQAPWVYDITNNTSTTGIDQTITTPFIGVWEDGYTAFSGTGYIKYSTEITG